MNSPDALPVVGFGAVLDAMVAIRRTLERRIETTHQNNKEMLMKIEYRKLGVQDCINALCSERDKAANTQLNELRLSVTSWGSRDLSLGRFISLTSPGQVNSPALEQLKGIVHLAWR